MKKTAAVKFRNIESLRKLYSEGAMNGQTQNLNFNGEKDESKRERLCDNPCEKPLGLR